VTFPNLQMGDGPFLVRGPFITPNPSVGVASTKPTLTNPNAGTPSDSGTDGASVDTDVGNGTLYWAVVTDGGVLTNQQLKAGGAFNPPLVIGDDQAVSGTGTQTLPLINGYLQPETTYQIKFLQTNSAGTDSAQASVDLTTTA
jgi:hypothetical protein